MKRYFRTVVSGNDGRGGAAIMEEILYQEGMDPVVMAFRRNNALAGMNSITVGAPEEAFSAGTMEKPYRAPTARELKKKAREEAYRQRINERFSSQAPRSREYAGFRPRFGPEDRETVPGLLPERGMG